MDIGVCYFPEHWSKSQWVEDVPNMAEAGLQYVRMGEFSWGGLSNHTVVNLNSSGWTMQLTWSESTAWKQFSVHRKPLPRSGSWTRSQKSDNGSRMELHGSGKSSINLFSLRII